VFRAVETFALAAVVASVVAWSAPVCADDADDRYGAYVRDALAEYRRGNWDEAFRLFTDAHAVKPSARTFRGMGVTAFEARRYVSAIRYLRSALADTRKPLDEAQRAEVASALRRSEGFVARYRVQVTPDAAALAVDGRKPSFDDEGALLLDPGMHEVVISADGHSPETRRVEARAGEHGDLTVVLARTDFVTTRATRARIDAESDVETTDGTLRTWAWVSGGAGVAFAIAGTVLYASARSKHDAIEDACPPGVCARSEIQDRIDDSGGETQQTLAFVGWGAATVLLGTGVWLYLEGDTSSDVRVGVAPGAVRFAGRF